MNVITDQQTMLQLAFVADTDLNPIGGTECEDAHKAYDAIVKKIAALNESWTVVWGPAVLSLPPGIKDKWHFENLMYVVQTDANDYVAAIAGTNPEALLDWLIEDFDVRHTWPWPHGTSGNAGSISDATHNGLSDLLKIVPCDGLPGAGQKLVDFLNSVPKDTAITVATTGHSLGGALSPALALALVDLRGTWDPSGMAIVSPYAFAGATPGDAAFAAYFQSRFPNFLRVWNELDVVPHAWEVAQLEQIPSLYGQAAPRVQQQVGKLVERVKNDNYTQLGAGLTFRGPQPVSVAPNETAFFKEAVRQHIDAYKYWATNAI